MTRWCGSTGHAAGAIEAKRSPPAGDAVPRILIRVRRQPNSRGSHRFSRMRGRWGGAGRTWRSEEADGIAQRHRSILTDGMVEAAHLDNLDEEAQKRTRPCAEFVKHSHDLEGRGHRIQFAISSVDNIEFYFKIDNGLYFAPEALLGCTGQTRRTRRMRSTCLGYHMRGGAGLASRAKLKVKAENPNAG